MMKRTSPRLRTVAGLLAAAAGLLVVATAFAQGALSLDWTLVGGGAQSSGGQYTLAGAPVASSGSASGGSYGLESGFFVAFDDSSPASNVTPTASSSPSPSATATPSTTPNSPDATATPQSTSTPLATPPSIATVVPTPGSIQIISLPAEGTLYVPGEAAGGAILHVQARSIEPPPGIPEAFQVLASIEISFSTDSGTPVRELERDVTIELSYASYILSDEQIAQLAIYNATRDELLPTTLDRDRRVAIAQTRRFSVFTLAVVPQPHPRLGLPFVAVDGGF